MAIWDKDKPRADELIKKFNLCSVSAKGVSISYCVISDHPEESQIKEADAVFLSFDGDESGIAEAVGASAAIRRSNKSCLIVLVSDKGADFGEFFRPSISPCGVMCRPFAVRHFNSIFNEVIDEIQRRKTESERKVEEDAARRDDSKFEIKAGGSYYSFYCRDILFFEAQSKKIAIKTFGQEVSFYGSIETVGEGLPAYFARCHRSFIVNSNHIESASLAEMEICLKDGSAIPISRSYRGDMKNILMKINERS